MEPAAGIMVSESSVWEKRASIEQRDNDVILSEPARGAQDQPERALFAPTGELNIYCIYNANPSELLANSTRWFKDGKVLHTGPDSTARIFESMTPTGYPVLTLRQVNRRDAGLYDCQLSNPVGTSERLPPSEACKVEVNFKPSVQLRVFKPQISVLPSNTHEGSLPMNELTELDLSQELILPGSTFVLICDVVEAQPNNIHKYHWFKTGTAKQSSNKNQQEPATTTTAASNLVGVTKSKQFVLSSLAANFTPSSFSCSAFNSLGQSEQSNRVELELSYAPGKSFDSILSLT